jgi:catechol 2,3-dioxygenase-like lactoylglutathione lyase family enzyme
MALELYMLGLTVQDMDKSLEFYRRLGLAIPEGSEGQTHVQVKMGGGFTFFLDSNPARWDPRFASEASRSQEVSDNYPSVLEFYLKTQIAVEEKYAELADRGYQGYRAPYATAFGMCFAMVKDPDGNTILLSGDLEKQES